jgi:hypothetical protein
LTILHPVSNRNRFMDSSAFQIAQSELRPGESLRWAGKPTPLAVALRSTSLLHSAFGIFFTLIPGSMALEALMSAPMRKATSNVEWMFVLIPLLIAASGVWLFLTVPRAWLMAHWTIYGITNQRVFISRRFPSHATKSWSFQDLNALDRKDRADGWGDLVFRRDTVAARKGTVTVHEGFYGIPEVRKVEAMIAEFKQRAQAA